MQIKTCAQIRQCPAIRVRSRVLIISGRNSSDIIFTVVSLNVDPRRERDLQRLIQLFLISSSVNLLEQAEHSSIMIVKNQICVASLVPQPPREYSVVKHVLKFSSVLLYVNHINIQLRRAMCTCTLQLKCRKFSA